MYRPKYRILLPKRIVPFNYLAVDGSWKDIIRIKYANIVNILNYSPFSKSILHDKDLVN
jgi:hypothetical protein